MLYLHTMKSLLQVVFWSITIDLEVSRETVMSKGISTPFGNISTPQTRAETSQGEMQIRQASRRQQFYVSRCNVLQTNRLCFHRWLLNITELKKQTNTFPLLKSGDQPPALAHRWSIMTPDLPDDLQSAASKRIHHLDKTTSFVVYKGCVLTTDFIASTFSFTFCWEGKKLSLQKLSSVLGNAKPLVATEEDIQKKWLVDITLDSLEPKTKDALCMPKQPHTSLPIPLMLLTIFSEGFSVDALRLAATLILHQNTCYAASFPGFEFHE